MFASNTIERSSRMTRDAGQDFVIALDHAYTVERYFGVTGHAPIKKDLLLGA